MLEPFEFALYFGRGVPIPSLTRRRHADDHPHMTTPAPHDRTEQRRRIGPRAAAALVLAPVALAAMVNPVYAGPFPAADPVPGGSTTTTTTPVVPATTTTVPAATTSTTTTVAPTHQPPVPPTTTAPATPPTTVAPAPAAPPPHAALHIRVGP